MTATTLQHKKESTISVLKVIKRLLSSQLRSTFGRDDELVDRDIIDVVLSNPENKRKLLERLKDTNNPDFSIVIRGNSLDFKE